MVYMYTIVIGKVGYQYVCVIVPIVGSLIRERAFSNYDHMLNTKEVAVDSECRYLLRGEGKTDDFGFLLCLSPTIGL